MADEFDDIVRTLTQFIRTRANEARARLHLPQRRYEEVPR